MLRVPLLQFALLVCAQSVPNTLTVSNDEVAVTPLRIDGLVSAVFTPFDDNGVLNVSVVPKQNAYLKSTGVEWVFVGGTTGESLSLTMEERKTLLQEWMKTGTNVIAHVGAESINDAKALAHHAQSEGAKAIGTMPPVFFSPASATALAMVLQQICGAASNIPCYYYHIPSMTHYDKPMIDLVMAIEKVGVPNFAGIKYTGLYTFPGFMDAQRVMNHNDGKYEVLSGREDMMLEGLSIGIKGHVGSQFNFAGDLYNSIRETFESDGLTNASAQQIRGLQMRAVNLIAAWLDNQPPGVNGAKYFMELAGVPVGSARLPSMPMDQDDRTKLRGALVSFCSGDQIAARTLPMPASTLKICAALG